MEYALIGLTVLSSVTAVAMSAIVLKMLRDERRRSDARVEALVRLTELDDEDARADLAPPPSRSRFDGAQVATERAFDVVPLAAVSAAGVRVSRTDTDLDLHEHDSVAGINGLFAQPDHTSPWIRRLGIAAAFAVAVTLLASAAIALSRSSTGGDNDVTTVSATSNVSASLELLSLTHEQSDNTLTITGVVQNPKSAAAISGVSATVLVFAADGTALGSGRAPLDFTRLQPGDESPFVLKLPITGKVARYRIGFRGEDGRVISHVDRRDASPLARKE